MLKRYSQVMYLDEFQKFYELPEITCIYKIVCVQWPLIIILGLSMSILRFSIFLIPSFFYYIKV